MDDTYLPLTKVCPLLAFRRENSQCYNLIRIQVPEEGLVIKMKRSANVVPLKKTTDVVEEHLNTFDDLDFDVFSNQKWTRLHESHSKDVKVNWPDGHSTLGIEKHIEDLKAMFVYAPDTSIKVHPVKFGSGEYTSVIGVGSSFSPRARSSPSPCAPLGIGRTG
jgi:hypothetical protein